jgi:hypothetical protein
VEEIKKVFELLYGPGDPMQGSEMNDAQALAYAEGGAGYSAFCIVRNWVWINLDLSHAEVEDLQRTGRQPAVIYSPTVIFDSARRWGGGDIVRTSLLSSFEENFIFKTSNTAYLLLGDGLRKSASLSTMLRIS